MKELTSAQNEALEKAWDLLSEHFDHVAMVIETEVKDSTDKLVRSFFHGGKVVAGGLFLYGIQQTMVSEDEGRSDQEPEKL